MVMSNIGAELRSHIDNLEEYSSPKLLFFCIIDKEIDIQIIIIHKFLVSFCFTEKFCQFFEKCHNFIQN